MYALETVLDKKKVFKGSPLQAMISIKKLILIQPLTITPIQNKAHQ
mgnify:CR=1 FL=1